ncbi:hypothetical protein NXH64_09240 [Butyrivibrio fibrisolvens]|uniref:hypothetical protein n=1 Tax=Pseudobutyrivibrio ruminis TaxID=46206 RepID=UPI0004840787|nr:hypothetical protein [Pseudobutyrivibrio ruminis]MDC7279684.1 hypothetical protein [Butyrivibrio fibrisolvens]
MGNPFKWRTKLFQTMLDQGYSQNTRLLISEKMKDMTDQQKEEKSAQMYTMLKESKTEQEFISQIQGSQM